MFNIETHNGEVTVFNPATNGHRTFQLRTQPKDAKFAPTKRILALLTGPDNESCYTPFAFINQGYISIWKKKSAQSPVYAQYADMLQNPAKYAGKAEYKCSTTCRVCNRKLTTPESIDSGIGPVCAGRSVTKAKNPPVVAPDPEVTPTNLFQNPVGVA